MWEWLIYTALILLFLVAGYEWLRGHMFAEGFTNGDRDLPDFFSRYFPRRYDIVPGQVTEAEGWVRNPRYFEGYVDVQRFGYKADFCRVVEKQGDPDSRIMSCALAGQEGLDSFTYRTDSARGGMRFSRDDYFRDVNGDKRDDYCRILKVAKAPADAWEARCIPAGNTRFRQGTDIQDVEPPRDIADLLWFYEGIMVWYRWIDDMLDYAENTRIQVAGGLSIDETPKRPIVKGLPINRLVGTDGDVTGSEEAANEYIRIGENDRLEFDEVVDLKELRCVSVWAYFDAFTNNARIFDFGNAAGRDNILLGIQGRGNIQGGQFGRVGARPTADNKVCQAKTAEEVSPYVYMKTTDANIDEWTCPAAEPIDSLFPEDEVGDITDIAKSATLLFEIWDAQQRKMRILVEDAIPLRRWVHIAITTSDMDVVRPAWHVYINGIKVYEHLDGFLPLKSYTAKNYIGRSNWETGTSQYADRDERFRGALFDFRMYRQPMSKAKVTATYEWGASKLDIDGRVEQGLRMGGLKRSLTL